jgi:hypothetical protein
MFENLFAYTPEGIPNPPYLSINREEDGRISVTVRGEYIPAVHTENSVSAPRQDHAKIYFDSEVGMDLVCALFNQLFFKHSTPRSR